MAKGNVRGVCKETIVSPETGRCILVGGRTYKRLIDEKKITARSAAKEVVENVMMASPKKSVKKSPKAKKASPKKASPAKKAKKASPKKASPKKAKKASSKKSPMRERSPKKASPAKKAKKASPVRK
jgi:single-stranded DNA-binding protein